MTKGTLRILDEFYDLSIDSSEINGRGGRHCSKLYMPIQIKQTFKSGASFTSFELITAKAKLYFNGTNIELSEETKFLSHRIDERGYCFIHFEFTINESKIAFIEKNRKTNLELSISLELQIGLLEPLLTKGSKGETVEKYFIAQTSISSSERNIVLQIEQSKWVSEILPRMDYKPIRLIELPSFSEVLPTEYEISINEFTEANKYYLNGDYDKTVAHCRAAIDPFKRKLPEIKSFIKSNSEYDWANKILESTGDWLETMVKQTFILTSKTHHAPSIGHFTRTDAEIIMMLSTGIIAYMGKLKIDLNKL